MATTHTAQRRSPCLRRMPAAPSVIAIATAQNLGLAPCGVAAAGVAMDEVLYPPAFGALTRWHGADRGYVR